MKTVSLPYSIATAALLAISAQAAQVAFSARTPTVGPDDISNLAGAAAENENVSKGDNDATYTADDRPIQGQTFTTGTNSAGYQLGAVTLREVKCETYSLIPDLKYTIRVTKASSNALEVVATEEAEVAADLSGNIPTIGGGDQMGTGSGVFITFTFAKPITLKPNTRYGFDVGGGTSRHYWQVDGTVSNAYAGGEAYSSGSGGVGAASRTVRPGDRVFIVALSPAGGAVGRQAKASSAGAQILEH